MITVLLPRLKTMPLQLRNFTVTGNLEGYDKDLSEGRIVFLRVKGIGSESDPISSDVE